MEVFGQHMAQKELGSLLGDPSQIASIRQLRFDSGPEAGQRLIQIRNAVGLCVDLLPDRCLDIGQVWMGGVPFAWMGSGGLPSAATGATLATALGGLMATCGFDHIRQSEEHDGITYPLHGSMALHPALLVRVGQEGPQAGGDFVVEAGMTRVGANAAQYRLVRKLRISYDRPTIVLEDRVETVPGAPIMAMYHFNLGYPLMGSSTRIEGQGAAFWPETASATRCFPSPPAPANIRIINERARRRMALGLRYETETLPYLQTHRRAEPGNLFCLEPASHDRLPRGDALGALAEQHGHRVFRLALEFDSTF
tara:strand:- start:47 stop:976 length:930 start_codon:yes stop_codon:yes gene_type:complete